MVSTELSFKEEASLSSNVIMVTYIITSLPQGSDSVSVSISLSEGTRTIPFSPPFQLITIFVGVIDWSRSDVVVPTSARAGESISVSFVPLDRYSNSISFEAAYRFLEAYGGYFKTI